MANLGKFSSVSLSFPVLPVMIPALVHFTLVSFALVSPLLFSFLFTHLLLLVAAFWTALDRKRYEPVVCFMVVLVVSGITDMVLLGLSFNILTTRSGSTGQFSAAMVIINLLGKPVTLILSALALYFRRESFGINFNLSKHFGGRSAEEAQPYQTSATYPANPEYNPEEGYSYPTNTDQPPVAEYIPPQAPQAEYVPQ